MAIYHLAMQLIKRKEERSAVFAAAYRAGEKLVDKRLGKVADYSKKRRPLHTEILAPSNAPTWVYDRERLWNAVEMSERRKDAQVAREFNVALPAELSPKQQIELVRGYVREQFVERGMVADISLNNPPKSDSLNFYAHVMLTTREIDSQGFTTKNRDWNSPSILEEWRAAWAEHANKALAKAGRKERIDHRTLKAQGLDREPTIHVGLDNRDNQESKSYDIRKQQNQQIPEGNLEGNLQKISHLNSSLFYQVLLEAYEGQCAITGFNLAFMLEETQICPLEEGDSDGVENRLLLRSDIRRLFDRHLLTVHPETKEVHIGPELKNTSYSELDGKKLRLPEDETLWPSKELLEQHYSRWKEELGLKS